MKHFKLIATVTILIGASFTSGYFIQQLITGEKGKIYSSNVFTPAKDRTSLNTVMDGMSGNNETVTQVLTFNGNTDRENYLVISKYNGFTNSEVLIDADPNSLSTKIRNKVMSDYNSRWFPLGSIFLLKDGQYGQMMVK